ncbi:septum formation family protein [Nocardioides sp.]|uniref:septum formation family protein n=1 Tax=Nocardioides sp. TaxID=35761 RepID=UPI003528A816
MTEGEHTGPEPGAPPSAYPPPGSPPAGVTPPGYSHPGPAAPPPGGPYPAPYAGYPAPPQPPRRGWSTGAIVGLVLGLVLGIPALVVAVTFVFGAQIRSVFEDTATPERGPDGQVTGARQIPTTDVRPGDCLVDSGFGSPDAGATAAADGTDPVVKVTVVPCSEPHEVETYYTSELTEDSYPGVQQITREIEAICRDQFQPFVGVALDDSELYASYYYPLEKTWVNDKGYACVVSEASMDTTGSLEDARR